MFNIIAYNEIPVPVPKRSNHDHMNHNTTNILNRAYDTFILFKWGPSGQHWV